jgi:hypothetical protein
MRIRLNSVTSYGSLLPLAIASALPGADATAIAIGAPASELIGASAANLTTAELARRLLPPDLANRMVSHELGEPTFPGGPIRNVNFYTPPVPLGQDLCRRESYYVKVEPVGGATRENSTRDVPVEAKEISSPHVQLAAAPHCRLKDGFFAWVWPQRHLSGATAALRRLAWLRKEAGRSGSLPVLVTCATETPEDACRQGARAVLASLPLHKVFLIELIGLQAWRLSVMPSGPGETFWEVKLHVGEGAEQRLDRLARASAFLKGSCTSGAIVARGVIEPSC